MSKNPAEGNDKGKVVTATNLTVDAEIRALRQENAEQKEAIDTLTGKLKTTEKYLEEINADVMSSLREAKIKRIMDKSNYTRDELEQQYPPGDKESLGSLQKLDESLSRGLGVASAVRGKTGTFKPVTSSAKDSLALGTLPDLYNKPRATVLKELSEM